MSTTGTPATISHHPRTGEVVGHRADSSEQEVTEVLRAAASAAPAVAAVAPGVRRDWLSLECPVIRHMNNLESVLTYEGTVEMHTLVIGQALTGHAAYR